MYIVEQVVVTSIRELSDLIRVARLELGDDIDRQVNLIIGKRGKAEVSTPRPFNTISDGPVNDQNGH